MSVSSEKHATVGTQAAVTASKQEPSATAAAAAAAPAEAAVPADAPAAQAEDPAAQHAAYAQGPNAATGANKREISTIDFINVCHSIF
jgi:hypothetical protein